MFSKTALISLLPLASAHFLLKYPEARGFKDETAANFPCGGFDSPSSERTEVSLENFPIQLEMHHTGANVQVLLGVGNNPGSAYNTVLRDTFAERGPNNFCIGGVSIPSSVNLTEGMNATIQVVTNGDPDGGLYQCADVTITSKSLSTDDYNSHCKNSTGVTTQAGSGNMNANQTKSGSGSSSSSSSSSSASSTSSAENGAAHAGVAGWAISVVGAAAGMAALL